MDIKEFIKNSPQQADTLCHTHEAGNFVVVSNHRFPNGSSLSSVCLNNVIFVNCDFSEVLLTDSSGDVLKLKNSVFIECDFSGATFDNVVVENCSFKECIFYKAVIVASSMLWCTFDNCDFKHSLSNGACFVRNIMKKGTWSNAYFCSVTFIKCELENISFSDSVAYKLKLSDCVYERTGFNYVVGEVIIENENNQSDNNVVDSVVSINHS